MSHLRVNCGSSWVSKKVTDSAAWAPIIGVLAAVSVIIAVASITPLGYASASGPSLSDETELLSYGFGLDPNLSHLERESLAQDVNVLSQMQLNADPRTPFRLIFAGEGVAQIKKYLKRRLNFILSLKNDADLAKIVGTSGASVGSQNQAEQLIPMAQNTGAITWFTQWRTSPGQNQTFSLGGKTREVNSSRIGIMKLGPGYSQVAEKPYPPEVISMFRLGTLIHEARHSDCTGGFDEQDVAEIKSGYRYHPRNNACGHFHTKCPPGNDFAGLKVCDDHPWGAYSIAAVYFLAVAESCSNCTQLQKQWARAFYVDSAARVQRFPDMMRGKLGPPDMSSSGQNSILSPEIDKGMEIFQQ
ncbi:hypothetical protein WDW86_21490 [Bdellovibrionota bacterium FG-2]